MVYQTGKSPVSTMNKSIAKDKCKKWQKNTVQVKGNKLCRDESKVH